MPSMIHNAQTGEHITFLPNEGDVLRMRFAIDGGGLVAAEHIHPELEERFEVVTGKLPMRLNGHEREVHAGERVVVPAGVPHAWWNTSLRSLPRSASTSNRRLESRAFCAACTSGATGTTSAQTWT
jgi:quercetin dioxygenase-like cupin family protein